MKVKITINTPRNQAEKSMATNRAALLGIKHGKKIIEEKLVAHNQFYWVLDVGPDDMQDIAKRCVRGEYVIRKFYSVLFKLIKRANRIATRSRKAGEWIRRWVVKRLKKMQQDPEQDGLAKQFENMPEKEFVDFLKVTDEAEVRSFLDGPLIILEDYPA